MIHSPILARLFHHGDTENTEKILILFSVFSVSPWLVFWVRSFIAQCGDWLQARCTHCGHCPENYTDGQADAECQTDDAGSYDGMQRRYASHNGPNSYGNSYPQHPA